MLNRILNKKLSSCMVMMLWSSMVCANESCNIEDLQQCHSCSGLTKAVDMKNPDQGEYYHNAYWNGLYAAYRLDCRKLGQALLEQHANPNSGGTMGSLLVSVASKWPHNNVGVNEYWANLLLQYRIDPNWKNPHTRRSAKELIQEDEIAVDYPGIWQSFTAPPK